MRKFWAGALLVAAGLVLAAAPAYAHAALIGTNPADGARLDTMPASVALTFSENVATPAFVVITAPDGTRVATSRVRAVDNTVRATVAPTDIKGTYSMSYRVVSADSHPVEGSITFDVTSGRTVSQAAPTQAKAESFTHRHRSHFLWGGGIAVVAIGLLLWPLKGKND